MAGAGRVEKKCVEDWIFTTYLVDAKPGGAATVVGQRLPPGKISDHPPSGSCRVEICFNDRLVADFVVLGVSPDG